MALEVINLSKSYGNKKVINDISFSVEEGMILGLIGRKGTGKTTVLKCIVGMTDPEEGEILFNGKKIEDKGVSIGYFPEKGGIYENVKVVDLLLYFAKLKGMSREESMEQIMFFLQEFGISGSLNQKIKTLSNEKKKYNSSLPCLIIRNYLFWMNLL